LSTRKKRKRVEKKTSCVFLPTTLDCDRERGEKRRGERKALVKAVPPFLVFLGEKGGTGPFHVLFSPPQSGAVTLVRVAKGGEGRKSPPSSPMFGKIQRGGRGRRTIRKPWEEKKEEKKRERIKSRSATSIFLEGMNRGALGCEKKKEKRACRHTQSFLYLNGGSVGPLTPGEKGGREKGIRLHLLFAQKKGGSAVLFPLELMASRAREEGKKKKNRNLQPLLLPFLALTPCCSGRKEKKQGKRLVVLLFKKSAVAIAGGKEGKEGGVLAHLLTSQGEAASIFKNKGGKRGENSRETVAITHPLFQSRHRKKGEGDSRDLATSF